MNPPLREDIDVKQLKKTKDGTIDCIASDHAPHTSLDKECEFNYASFGIIGMETTLSLVITELVNKKILSLSDAIKKLNKSCQNSKYQSLILFQKVQLQYNNN